MKTNYIERLLPSVWQTAATMLLVPAVWLITLPLAGPAAIFLGLTVWIIVISVMVFRSKTVSISNAMLHAGTASIPVSLLGKATIFTPDEYRLKLGPELDARAFLCFKSGKKSLIRIELADKSDSTPYWLISSNRPAELLKALGQ